MSIVKAVDIQCDECLDQYDELGSPRAEEVRESARIQGWRTNLPGGRDLCPNCR